MKNKILAIIMAVLCAILIFQTGYLVGLGKDQQIYNSISGRYRQPHPMVRMQEDWGYASIFNEQQRLRPISLTKVISRETEGARIITMSLPGMGRDGINVEVKGRYLTIEGKQVKAGKSTAFLQILSLPGGIKIPSITAEYNKGILTITMPKDKEINKPPLAAIKIPVK